MAADRAFPLPKAAADEKCGIETADIDQFGIVDPYLQRRLIAQQ
jgi:hypothetical protein